MFFRSTISLTDSVGNVINSYSYDPFGKVIEKFEKEKNEFLFIGQWGVRALDNIEGIYNMRSRMYIVRYGRFMSLDSYGFAGKTTNLYSYVANNPIAGEHIKYLI